MTKGDEPKLHNWIRIILGWAAGLFVLLGPLPYSIPWWGRFVVAFLLISIAHSTVTGIILSNVAKSGPAIVGLVRGAGVGNRRAEPADSDSTTVQPAIRRRKSDKIERPE